VKRAEKQSQIRTSKVDSSRQSGVLVLLGVLFTIILAGLDNTIVSTVMPVALPELGRSGDRDPIAGDVGARTSSALSRSRSGARSAPSRAR